MFTLVNVKLYHVYRANDLWSQLRKKSELYQSDVVLMPHGDDFRYNIEAEWNDQFNNLDKLMDYINNRPDMNMKVFTLI